MKEQARSWAREEAPVSQFREMRDSGNEYGFDKGTWAGIGEMGWAGIVVTLAVDEGPRHAPTRTALRAEGTNGGFVLTGKKVHVVEGLSADAFIVVARTSGQPGDEIGLSLFLVEGDAKGVTRQRLVTADSRGHAQIEFGAVKVSAEALLGRLDEGNALLTTTLDHACAGLAAEMLGTAAQSFDMTLEYLKTRVQFGNVIGSFQALGHRAAELFTEMEMARSCVEAALQALDEATEDASQLCSLAKCKAGDFLHHMSNELIQIHGGIGMTDEFDAGLYLKRARALEATYGNQAYHRDRYASLIGI